jgi:hypothetical protein
MSLARKGLVPSALVIGRKGNLDASVHLLHKAKETAVRKFSSLQPAAIAGK